MIVKFPSLSFHRNALADLRYGLFHPAAFGKRFLNGIVSNRVFISNGIVEICVRHQFFTKRSGVILEYAVLRPEEGCVVKEIFVISDVSERVIQIPERSVINLCGFTVFVGILEKEHTAEIGIPVFHQFLNGIYGRKAFHIDVFAVMDPFSVISRFGIDRFFHIGKKSRDIFHFLFACVFGGFHNVNISVLRDEMARLRFSAEIQFHKITARNILRRSNPFAIRIFRQNRIIDQTSVSNGLDGSLFKIDIRISFFGCLFQILNIDSVTVDLHLFAEHIHTEVFSVHVEMNETVINVIRNVQDIAKHKTESVMQGGLVCIIGKQDPGFCLIHTQKLGF